MHMSSVTDKMVFVRHIVEEILLSRERREHLRIYENKAAIA